GARVAEIDGAGHSPNVEKPEETARLVLEFAADASDNSIEAPPPDIGQNKPGGNKPGGSGGNGNKPSNKPQNNPHHHAHGSGGTSGPSPGGSGNSSGGVGSG